MSFHSRQYGVYAMLGDPKAEAPWLEESWLRVAAALDPLIESSRGRAAVRSMQLQAGTASPNKVSFGRIGWNAEGHKKWVWQSTDSNTNRIFHTSEVWAPSWTACENERLAPDVYFAFRNEGDLARHLTFNPACILAVARDLDGKMIEQGRKSAETVADVLQALLRAHCERPWGYPFGPGYTKAINDMVVTGLFKPGPRHQSPVSTSILDGTWNTF